MPVLSGEPGDGFPGAGGALGAGGTPAAHLGAAQHGEQKDFARRQKGS